MSKEYQGWMFCRTNWNINKPTIDTLRIRVQTSTDKSIALQAQNLLKEGGIRSFYKGVIPPIIWTNI